MGKQNVSLLAFNRGIVSKSALSRVDVDRIRLSAEVMVNWMPKTQGSMFLRPGFEYLGSSKSDAQAIDIPFVAATDDTALLEITNGVMRVWVGDQLVSRASVSTTVPNGNFATSTGWTDASTLGGALTFGGSGLVLDAINVGGEAVCRRQITVASGDQNIRHALVINVTRGPVTFRCGSSSGGDDYITETTLRTGYHSLAFTPAGNFWIQFANDKNVDRIVASCGIAAAGTMEVTVPWGANDLSKIHYAQSADVMFVACDGYQQRRIERRAVDSWSVVLYAPDNGPFSAGRTNTRVRLKVASTYGNTTLTADKPFFKAGHVGALFRMFNQGVNTTTLLAGEGSFTKPFRVTGVYNGIVNERSWYYGVAGTWSGNLHWERSFDGPDSGYRAFRAYDGATGSDITSNTGGPTGNGDEDNNSVVWYKIGFEEGLYTSGAAVITVIYPGGGDYGVCRVLAVNSSTEAQVEVLEQFSTSNFTPYWQESLWTGVHGYPSTVVLDKGRLWWFGKTRFTGSISDDYESFDPEEDGDAGPIIRTFGSGPIDKINFALPLARIIAGTAGGENSIKSSSFDEPLTPQNIQATETTTQGSRAGVRAAKVDNRGVFVQRSGKRVFELVYDPEAYDYTARELTLLAPDITGMANVVGVAVQRQPDTRIHCWLDDGTVILLTYEPDEDVACWSRVETGFVEHVAVLPGEEEDQVYYRVKRTVDGSTKRYLEKMALERECVGGALNKQADSFIVYAGSSTTAIAGLDHLEGEAVVAWGSGKFLGTFTVTSGSITLPEAVTSCVVGLGYEARYKTTKLAYAAEAGTALLQKKRVPFFGVILQNTHNDGLYFGRDFGNMDPLPRTVDGRLVTATEVFEEYDKPAVSFPGDWSTDSRVCLKASAPKPCELLAAVLSMDEHDKV